ncbi:MAG: hypothetical protein EBU93_03100 [Chlamydiae bacterium]|jgi:hypothetical protein|nr:hypothetical protein [Chlamydiota bacterium]
MDESFGHIPLLDAIDLDILMHKDAHFGGNFSIMLEYYENDGIGVMPDFDIERIEELHKIEHSLQTSLSEQLLPLPAKQLVERSKKTYEELRAIYDQDVPSLAKAFSDLILSEEEYPEKEIEAILQYQEQAFQPSVHLLNSSDYYDPLFPGYGRMPIFAAEILQKLQDERAIPYLFAALGQENFFTDDAIIHALISFKEKGKYFLLKRLTHEPFTKENMHAITALTALEDDEEVAKVALMMLNHKALQDNENFLRYLIFACSGLKHEVDRMKFVDFQSSLKSKILQSECQVIIKNWM